MSDLELKFDPKTIEHLGVKMYSTLPPALAELISNAYDADATEVKIQFHEKGGSPHSITVIDTGFGMSDEDIQKKFLVIGRNRRKDDGDKPSPTFNRLPTGKKGLGKLALFGLAKKISVDTVRDGLRNKFTLDWDSLLSADGTYKPTRDVTNEQVDRPNGTIIRLSELKRKSTFDLEGIADSLARIFIVDDNFRIVLKTTESEKDAIYITNDRRYSQLNSQFQWEKADLLDEVDGFYSRVDFKLITTETPIPPSSGARGVTIFSRGKLVNAPEYFSVSTSSHFFQYLTGWITADFIDLLDEDVISTNRQAINWDNPEMVEFREFLGKLIARVNSSWRQKRSEKKDDDFKASTGIDREKWFSTLPKEVKGSVEKIVETMAKDEAIAESFEPVVRALHQIVPEYPLLHWRHLHESLKPGVEGYYKNQQYGVAADQGTKIYGQLLRDLTGEDRDGTDLASFFSVTNPKISICELDTVTGRNIQDGQGHLTRGLMLGFRNPINHAPIEKIVPGKFSELDCLNVLSLVSYLITRLDYAKVPQEE